MWPHPSTRTPVPGVMKFTILVDPSLVITTIYSTVNAGPVFPAPRRGINSTRVLAR